MGAVSNINSKREIIKQTIQNPVVEQSLYVNTTNEMNLRYYHTSATALI